ncbi:hypothetical protein AQ505_07220 [Pedobacter sp. PACM 27299]|nr:hypothetical protein AQ505_07220 [Pedobacter sp. PACM 27299]
MITVDAVPVVYPFLNPLTDFGFKHLFGTDANKDLLISFLNALFKVRKEDCGCYLSANSAYRR